MSQLHSIKQYIIEEFIPNGHSEDITDDLDLIENGILDSLAILKLVAFIEDQFDVALDPEEIDPQNLKTINAISSIIQIKTAA